MNIASIEKSLCTIYLNSKNNQKKDVNDTGKRNVYADRLNNLKRQFPYDMEKLLEKHGIE